MTLFLLKVIAYQMFFEAIMEIRIEFERAIYAKSQLVGFVCVVDLTVWLRLVQFAWQCFCEVLKIKDSGFPFSNFSKASRHSMSLDNLALMT